VPSDDWEAVSMVAMNGSLMKASRKMNKSFELLCNFSFLSDPVCEQTGIMRWDQYMFLLKKCGVAFSQLSSFTGPFSYISSILNQQKPGKTHIFFLANKHIFS
jgi:hypothetical protein